LAKQQENKSEERNMNGKLCIPFLCLAFTLLTTALPTVRDKANEASKTETKAKLENELNKLSNDGVAVSKTEKVDTKTINGKTEQQTVEGESISDAKTGQVIAKVEKTVSTNEKGEQTKNVQIDMPIAGVHEELQGEEAENFELIEPETVAQYIFETDDVDGVQNVVENMVDSKKISKKSAQSYMDQVRGHLNEINEQALQEYEAQEEEKRTAEDGAYQDMLELTDMLNTNFNTEQSLYVYVKKLYSLYRTEGDEYAKNILSQYTNLVQQETESGNISEAVQDEIFNIMLQALKDVNEENVNVNGQQVSNTKNETPKEKKLQINFRKFVPTDTGMRHSFHRKRVD